MKRLLAIFALSVLPLLCVGEHPEVTSEQQEIIDALAVIVQNELIPTEQVIQLAQQHFPGWDIAQIVVFALGVHDWEAPGTGWDDPKLKADHWRTEIGFYDWETPGSGWDGESLKTQHWRTDPDLQGRRGNEIVEDSQLLAAALVAAGRTTLPSPARGSALEIAWRRAVEAKDYKEMAVLVLRIAAADARRERIRQTTDTP